MQNARGLQNGKEEELKFLYESKQLVWLNQNHVLEGSFSERNERSKVVF